MSIFQFDNATLLEYVNLACYVILSALDLFQMCYFGENMKQQSLKVGNALLRCPWHLCGGPFRRGVLIILSNSMKPLVITGGKFFILDFDKMTGVSNNAQNQSREEKKIITNYNYCQMFQFLLFFFLFFLCIDFNLDYESIIFILHFDSKNGKLICMCVRK